MANTTPNRLGQVNATGDNFALFLKVFSGEVLAQYDFMQMVSPLIRSRTLIGAKSAQFPVVGTSTAKYFTPGQSIYDPANSYLSTIRQGERTITIDKKLLDVVFIDDLDEVMNHYDLRGEYSHQLGESLANAIDLTVMKVILLASRVTANSLFTGSPGGSKVVEATGATDGDKMVDALFAAAEALDVKNVSPMGRVALIGPSPYYALVNSSSKAIINRDFGNDGNGSLRSGTVMEVAGIRVMKSNLAGQQFFGINHTDPGNAASTVTSNSYVTDASNTYGLVFTPDCAGTVKAMEMNMQSEYDIERQGHIFVARTAVGHGVLRPECAVEIASA